MIMDDQRLVLETHAIYLSDPVQTAIHQEVHRPSKQWVSNVIQGAQESEAVKIRHKDFILLPDTERVNRFWSVRQIVNKRYFASSQSRLNLLAILTEPGLRSLRDLRGRHAPVLENMYRLCLDKIYEETGIQEDQVMAYVHYPPSVYQLHVHFVHQPQPRNARDCYRVHSLHSVISNLRVDPDYYAKVDMHYHASVNSALYSAITGLYLKGRPGVLQPLDPNAQIHSFQEPQASQEDDGTHREPKAGEDA